jgi:hypothetical protein
MDVQSKRTIVRTMGRSTYAPERLSGRNKAKMEANPQTTHNLSG